jgi:hypothetical protein
MKKAIILVLVSSMMAFADFTPLAPKAAPLPDDEVGVLFNKISKTEKIELVKLYQALNGPQTTLRADAASKLGKCGDRSSVPYLIDALSDESMHVGARYLEAGLATTRYRANDSLKKLTGKDFGFVWNDPLEKRNQAITKWREWFQASGRLKEFVLSRRHIINFECAHSPNGDGWSFETDGTFTAGARTGRESWRAKGTWSEQPDGGLLLTGVTTNAFTPIKAEQSYSMVLKGYQLVEQSENICAVRFIHVEASATSAQPIRISKPK